jgi:hypothetical protein
MISHEFLVTVIILLWLGACALDFWYVMTYGAYFDTGEKNDK